jgi:hypothetical protein
MGNIIDNAVRLMNSDESIEVLLQRFFTSDDDGSKFFDFCKVVAPPSMVAITELEEQLYECLLGQSRNATEEVREQLAAAHQRFQEETGYSDPFQWRMRHWDNSGGSWDLAFPSPQLMTFSTDNSPPLRVTRRIAISIQRSFRHVWMDFQYPACGSITVTADGRFDQKDYTFESGLAPEWLWQDLGCGDGSWAPGFLEELSGGRSSPPDLNQLNRTEGL